MALATEILSAVGHRSAALRRSALTPSGLPLTAPGSAVPPRGSGPLRRVVVVEADKVRIERIVIIVISHVARISVGVSIRCR